MELSNKILEEITQIEMTTKQGKVIVSAAYRGKCREYMDNAIRYLIIEDNRIKIISMRNSGLKYYEENGSKRLILPREKECFICNYS